MHEQSVGGALKLVVDKRDWAFDHVAAQLIRVLDARFEASVVYAEDFDTPTSLFARLFIDSPPALVHFFWREAFLRMLRPRAGLLAISREGNYSPEEVAAALAGPAITFSVNDHLFLEERHLAARRRSVPFADGYSTVSKRLFGIYSEAMEPGPICVTPDMVDRSVFVPRGMDRFSLTDRPLVVGWVGNATWGQNAVGGDPKGFHSIVQPALETLKDMGVAVEGHFADRNQNWRSQAEMAAYYGEIDVLVCASDQEGTPLPVLEAISCGVPVVTTPVGIVEDVLGPRARQMMLPDRDPGTLVKRLGALSGDRDLLAALSTEALAIGLPPEREIAERWLELFSTAATRHAASRALKQVALERIVGMMQSKDMPRQPS